MARIYRAIAQKVLRKMGGSKNTLTLSLMTGSIVLVLVLQGFWLKSSYNETRESFRKETGFLFRATVMNLHDSLLLENIEAVPQDSLFGPSPPHKVNDSSHIAVMVASSRGKGNLAFSEYRKNEDARYFVLREADSLRIRDIETKYRAALTGADISIPFHIVKIAPDTARGGFDQALPAFRAKSFFDRSQTVYMGIAGPDRVELNEPLLSRTKEEIVKPPGIGPRHLTVKGELHAGLPPPYDERGPGLDHVFLPQTGLVSMQFDNSAYQWHLLTELAPQLLFSVAMILFISVSFYFMYRSIRMQRRLILLKNDFVSNMTHELKTPVATASVAIEALRNFQTKDAQRTDEYLEIAQNELSRLTLLTDNILKTAIFESRDTPAGIENIELKEIVFQVLASMKLVFEKKQAKVSFNAEGEHFQTTGGKTHIINLFYNLLDNALKYSPGKPEIIIRLKSLKEGTLLNIRDNGMGIPPEFHKKVFEKFFRVPSGNVHNIKGHGLGLSYVAGIVKSHGGTIRLDSQVGKGSTFIIYLPRKNGKNKSTVH